MENKTVIAINAKGKAMIERFNVYPIPNFENTFAVSKNNKARINANHAPSGSRAFETMNTIVTTALTRGSR